MAGTLLVAAALIDPLHAQGGASKGAPHRVLPALTISDLSEARRRLISLIRDTDPTSSGALYEAQQQAMTLAGIVFSFGSPIDQDTVLRTAAAKVANLPSPLSIGVDRVLVDNLAFPSGPAATRRVFPTAVAGQVNVLSEVELQYCYMLSTLVRLAVENPLAPGDTLLGRRRAAVGTIFQFLLRDKVGFYWNEVPAWHWTGPFTNMRERMLVKLADSSSRVRQPAWFGAILDHEFHLMAVAADLSEAVRLDRTLRGTLAPVDSAMLGEIRNVGLRVLRTRVTAGPDGRGFLIDYGRWTSNPSYAYAACETDVTPVSPCPIDSVATDASHARRWPWWLQSMAASWPSYSAERAEVTGYSARLAHQYASYVLSRDSAGRPVMHNYMDGRDGWYSLRDAPGKDWGYGPSTLSGSMRYQSWGLLVPYEPAIRSAYQDFCRVITSTDADDIVFRIRSYGSPSSNPALGGRGEVDLYSPSAFFALVCRLATALGSS